MPPTKWCWDVPKLHRLMADGWNANMIAGAFGVAHTTATWWMRYYKQSE
jgi:hypothetical protein